MMQNILGTEVTECMTNRQNSKIQYLQAENAQMQEDMKDMEKALKLNKEALRLAYEQRRFTQSNYSNSTTIGQSSSASTNALDTDAQNKLFDKLCAENKQLFDQLQRITRERNQAQTKVLIQEQVNEEAVAFQKDIIQELEEKILELRRIIHDKEYAIQELEKMKPIQDRDVAIKIREIITPNEQSIKLHSEIENHKQLIKKLSTENQQVKECNAKIKAFNRIIKRDVIKIRVALKNPVNFLKMKEFIHNDRLDHGDEDLLINKEFIREFYEEKDDWKEQQNLHLQQQMYNKNYYQNPNIKSKAQLIEDLSRLQMTVRNFKILYHREVQNSQLLLKQIDELQAFNTQVCETNQTLIDSHKPNQERFEKMKQEVDYYKQYYTKYMDKIRNRRKNNTSVTLEAPPLPANSNKFNPSRHMPTQSLPQNFLLSSPRGGCGPMITEAMENEEMTARMCKTERRDTQMQVVPTPMGAAANQQLNYMFPLVSPSYAQQQQQRVLFFMQSKNNNNNNEMTSMNAGTTMANLNNLSNNQQVNQQDYDLGAAYPNTARPFYNQNTNNNMNGGNMNPLLPEIYADNDADQSYDLDPNQEMNLQQCKTYLINLAKDFYENGNVKVNQKQIGMTKQLKDRLILSNQNNNHLKIGLNSLTRPKRSLSDPLGYIFQEDPKQKMFEEMQQQRQQENDHLRLFSVDMSMINGNFEAPLGKRSSMNTNKITIKNTLATNKRTPIDANASFISTDNDLNF